MIRVTCGQCGATLTVADSLAGKKGRCQKCRAVVTVPGPESSADDAPARSPTSSPDDTKPSLTNAQLATGKPTISFSNYQNSPIVRTIRTLVRLPSAAAEFQYGQIPYNARMVRWGAGIVWFWGWGTFLIGVLAVIVGVIAGALALVGGKIEAAAFAWTAISFGIGSVIAGIFGIAVAAFFRLFSHTCEAVRDAIILHATAAASDQNSTSAHSGERVDHNAVLAT